MGSILSFRSGPDGDLPPARAALVRNSGDIAGLETELAATQAMIAELESYPAKVAAAEAERDDLVKEDARGLIQRIRDGAANALATIGSKTEDLDARIRASRLRAKVAETSIEMLQEDAVRLTAAIADLKGRRPHLVRAVVNEAAEGLRADYQTTINKLCESFVRISALERLLAGERHDHVPASRVVCELPSFVWADAPSSGVIAAPEREIRRTAAAMADFIRALDSDPRAAFPELPEVDPSPDSDLIYHAMSAPERLEIDRRHAGIA
jgi:hypothetical protein